MHRKIGPAYRRCDCGGRGTLAAIARCGCPRTVSKHRSEPLRDTHIAESEEPVHDGAVMELHDRLPPEPASASAARRFVADAIERTPLACSAAAETAVLLVSEVVTNAVLHAGTAIRVSIRVELTSVRIEVRDGAVARPSRRHYDEGAATVRARARRAARHEVAPSRAQRKAFGSGLADRPCAIDTICPACRVRVHVDHVRPSVPHGARARRLIRRRGAPGKASCRLERRPKPVRQGHAGTADSTHVHSGERGVGKAEIEITWSSTSHRAPSRARSSDRGRRGAEAMEGILSSSRPCPAAWPVAVAFRQINLPLRGEDPPHGAPRTRVSPADLVLIGRSWRPAWTPGSTAPSSPTSTTASST